MTFRSGSRKVLAVSVGATFVLELLTTSASAADCHRIQGGGQTVTVLDRPTRVPLYDIEVCSDAGTFYGAPEPAVYEDPESGALLVDVYNTSSEDPTVSYSVKIDGTTVANSVSVPIPLDDWRTCVFGFGSGTEYCLVSVVP